ncbi:MAG: class I tRNA ligase family protein, partial [Candidatus Eremiobacteraeota bacterium]|nr:class I tRNA ligase family protein [Candidatus Eremiobacteraeota bacterium]
RSSMLTGVAIKGSAPYKHVVKNGWVNDEQGRAMSKSLGTGIDARDAIQKWGADVLRLSAASVEFTDDVRFGPAMVDQVSRVYRNIRNRVRFMLSNLDDLPVEAIVSTESMAPFDRLACSIGDAFVKAVRADYAAFSLHDAYLRIVEFEGAVSSLYFDALKDPLYSGARDSVRRRSAQSALLYLLECFAVALAPVLSFTAEEAWQSLPPPLRVERESVFDLSMGIGEHVPADPQSAPLWKVLHDLRARVAANPDLRDFEARVTVFAGGGTFAALSALGDNLREALVVSHVDLVQNDSEEPTVELAAAQGQKCARCWKYLPLGNDPAHPALCAPCVQVVNAL